MTIPHFQHANFFYRDRAWYRYFAVVLLVFISLVSCSIIGHLWWFARPKQAVFQLNYFGTLRIEVPLDQAHWSDVGLLSWIHQASSQIFDYNALDFDPDYQPLQLLDEEQWRQMWAALGKPEMADYSFKSQRREVFFTKKGLKQFYFDLYNDGVVEKLLKNFWLMRAFVDDMPEIISKTVNEGIFTWEVKVPLLLKYNGVRKNVEERYTAVMTIVRSSTLTTQYGCQIDDIRTMPTVQKAVGA